MPCIRVNDGSPEDFLELISLYFRQGYSNPEMLEFLKLHGVSISLSTQKRRLSSLGLSRKTNISADELRSAIERKLDKSGCFLRYSKMWARVRKKGIIVKIARVRTLLKELDPDNVESRQKKRLHCRAYHTKGPNIIIIIYNNRETKNILCKILKILNPQL